MSLQITDELLTKYATKFNEDPKNLLAQNIVCKSDPLEPCLNRKALESYQHVFTHKIKTEGKPMTNQKSSGRCWIFACLNCIRIPFMKQFNLDEFEFSQAHLFYWDKIERCNYFLHNVVETAKRGETVEGRLFSFLVQDPCADGGQWDMLVNLIARYGLMPKKCFPESFSCESSTRINAILRSKLREYSKRLRSLVEEKASDDKVKIQIEDFMEEIHRIVSICLGIPPETFTWEYYDNSKQYCKIGPVSPKDFYEQHVKPFYDVENKICLVSDPRPSNTYGRAYTVDCLGNLVGGRRTIYNNQPIDVLAKLAATSIQNDEAVWFGCEVTKRFAGSQGLQDLTAHNYPLVFGADVYLGLNKAERLLYGDSLMTHAMVFTGVTLDDEGKPCKWRVENSWGEDRGDKGYFLMTQDWFDEFVFEVVVDKKFVPDDVLQVNQQEPVVLPAWDPMGALA